MYSVSELYRFYKIIETTYLQFKTDEDFINKCDEETIKRLASFREKSTTNLKQKALLNIKVLSDFYAKQQKLISPLNEKLNKFIELQEKEFKSDYKKKHEFTYNNFVKKDDPGSFQVNISTVSPIVNDLRSIMVLLRRFKLDGLENYLDTLDCIKVINEEVRKDVLNEMVRYVDEKKPND